MCTFLIMHFAVVLVPFGQPAAISRRPWIAMWVLPSPAGSGVLVLHLDEVDRGDVRKRIPEREARYRPRELEAGDHCRQRVTRRQTGYRVFLWEITGNPVCTVPAGK